MIGSRIPPTTGMAAVPTKSGLLSLLKVVRRKVGSLSTRPKIKNKSILTKVKI